jgi:molybdate transport system regulatory protein
VRVRLTGGQEVTAAITLDAIDELKISDGDRATALVKSTDVSIAAGPVNGLSIRNQIPGTVTRIDTGTVMTTVAIEIIGGQTLVAAITKDGADELALAQGREVVALVKSTEVSLAVE